MMFTQRSLEVEHQWFYSLKVWAHFRSKELVDFSTYDIQIVSLTGATVKHLLRKYIKIAPPQLYIFHIFLEKSGCNFLYTQCYKLMIISMISCHFYTKFMYDRQRACKWKQCVEMNFFLPDFLQWTQNRRCGGSVTFNCERIFVKFAWSSWQKSGNILKVHKIENFFGSDFEFCTISLLLLLKY